MTAKVVSKSLGAMLAEQRGMTHKPAVQSVFGARLLLRPSEDGWSLLTPQGELVFRGSGPQARHRALEVAYERGVLAVLS